MAKSSEECSSQPLKKQLKDQQDGPIGVSQMQDEMKKAALKSCLQTLHLLTMTHANTHTHAQQRLNEDKGEETKKKK